MESFQTSKLPPDNSERGRRKSTTANFSSTQASQRQHTPIPNGPALTSGQPKLSQLRQPRRKRAEEPLDSISVESYKNNHVASSVTRQLTHVTESTHVSRASETEYRHLTHSKNAHSSVSNGVTTTPKENPVSESCADNSSPSLWLRKTPEEIVDFYRQLGPNWRNEYEKTDVTYSPSSPWYNKEVVPGSGIPVIPNMSREPVGAYARTMRNRRKTALDLNTYAVEVGRTAEYYRSHDRSASLAYGLNHSPSSHQSTPITRLAYPSHAYPQNNSHHMSSNYSSSAFSSSALVVRTCHVITGTVTKLFALVLSMLSLAWLRRQPQLRHQAEGVDTVDHAAYHQQNYEYKTGAKRSSMHRHSAIPSRSYLSSCGHFVFVSAYSIVTWLIETSTRIFRIKDTSMNTAVPNRLRNQIKYGLLVLMLLVCGSWLFFPLISDAVNSTVITATPEHTLRSGSDLSSPWTFTESYITTPLSSTAHFFQTSFTSCVAALKGTLYATGEWIVSPFYSIVHGTGSVLTIPSRAMNYVSVPFSGAVNFLSTIPATLWYYLSIPVYAACDVFTKGVTCAGGLLNYIWAMLWGSIQSVMVVSGGWVSSSGMPTDGSKVPPGVSLQQRAAMKQEETKPPPPPAPSVEDIVLRVLSDVRFQTMVEHNVRVSVEKTGDMRAREDDLQEKVTELTELCTRIVQSELTKFRSSVEEEKQTQQRLQSTTPVTIPVPDSEEAQRYKAQVDEMMSQMKSLKTDHQTSFIDLMTKLSGLIDDKIRAAFAVYDADRTGLTDYALESAGGAVVNIRCTETYTLKDPYYILFGYALWRRDSSPRKAIQPGLLPGDCWAFQGAVGCLVLKLSHRIKISKFSMEHIPRALTPNGEIDSAPNKFTVWGLRENHDNSPTFLGEFAYDSEGPTLQYFEALDTPDTFDMVELKILSNHGNIEYTCLYRFRVHGSLTAASPFPPSNYQSPHSTAANHNTYHSAADVKYNDV